MNKRNKLIALALAGCLSTSLVGCKKDEKIKTYDDYYNHYKYYTKVDIEDDKLVNKYRGYNVVIGINKETNEVNEFIYNAGDAKNYVYQGINETVLTHNKLGFIVEIYDLETGKLMYFNCDNVDYNVENGNLSKLIEENNFYNIYDLYDLGVEIKEWYTLDEIREIAKIVIDRNTKIKRLTNN